MGDVIRPGPRVGNCDSEPTFMVYDTNSCSVRAADSGSRASQVVSGTSGPSASASRRAALEVGDRREGVLDPPRIHQHYGTERPDKRRLRRLRPGRVEALGRLWATRPTPARSPPPDREPRHRQRRRLRHDRQRFWRVSAAATAYPSSLAAGSPLARVDHGLCAYGDTYCRRRHTNRDLLVQATARCAPVAAGAVAVLGARTFFVVFGQVPKRRRVLCRRICRLRLVSNSLSSFRAVRRTPGRERSRDPDLRADLLVHGLGAVRRAAHANPPLYQPRLMRRVRIDRGIIQSSPHDPRLSVSGLVRESGHGFPGIPGDGPVVVVAVAGS